MYSFYTTLDASGTPTTELTTHFNSYFRCGDKFFGISAEGVYELLGDDYNGTDIDTVIETFFTDLGHDGKNRVRYIYLTIETNGDVIVIPIVDDVEQTAVTFSSVTAGKQLLRKTVGRSSIGFNWKFRIQNVDGCWFAIKKVEVLSGNLSLGR